MDQTIHALTDILSVTDKEISDLLVFSVHNLEVTSQYGSMAHSLLSTFEIISPPIQTAMLEGLTEEQKQTVLNAIRLIYPVANNLPEVIDVRFVADPTRARPHEFIQYIDDDSLVNDISIALSMLERKPPRFWIEYRSNLTSRLLEDDFRSEFFRMLGMKYIVGSEEESKIGRTDLILKSTSINRKIFEFKIWDRNDFLNTTSQLLKYLTEIDDSGFVIMGNSRKKNNITEEEYKAIIKCPEYIEGSLLVKTTNHGIKYFVADYQFTNNVKKIFHFLLNLK